MAHGGGVVPPVHFPDDHADPSTVDRDMPDDHSAVPPASYVDFTPDRSGADRAAFAGDALDDRFHSPSLTVYFFRFLFLQLTIE